MVNHGRTKLFLKAGDQDRLPREPAKNGRPVGRITEVVLPNGQKVTGGFLAQADRMRGRGRIQTGRFSEEVTHRANASPDLSSSHTCKLMRTRER